MPAIIALDFSSKDDVDQFSIFAIHSTNVKLTARESGYSLIHTHFFLLVVGPIQ
jgi:hypothetical protein